jgi:hypothetical protein
LNNSKYGYDAVDNLLRLTLLRSPTWRDPDADREHHHFSYDLYPHGGNWKQALSVRRPPSFLVDISHKRAICAQSAPCADIERILAVKGLDEITTDVVLAERESLVNGQA